MLDWSYRLSDFLMFSPRVYWRMFELHNEALWPLPLATLAAGLFAGALALLRPAAARRIAPLLFAALWAWIAWSFFWNRYAAINWAAIYVAPAFALQATLLVLIAGVRGFESGPPRAARLTAAVLFAIALLYPVLAPLGGRSWGAAEILGIAPDPTAIATLAMLLVLRPRQQALLFPIPVLWCLASGLALWAMESAQAWLPAGAALAATVVAITLSPRSTRGA